MGEKEERRERLSHSANSCVHTHTHTHTHTHALTNSKDITQLLPQFKDGLVDVEDLTMNLSVWQLDEEQSPLTHHIGKVLRRGVVPVCEVCVCV